jgi:hypothetical protein
MQDFLKDRPVLSAQDVKIVSAGPAAVDSGSAGPFARIVRDEVAVAAAAAARTTGSLAAKSASPSIPAPPHTSQVKTVVENGRIARIVVTCSCGKVTEIACVY